MNLLRHTAVLFAIVLCSGNTLAGVFKCTDKQGNTAYQSSPCAVEKDAAEINIVTGGLTDLSIEKKKKELELELAKKNALKIQKAAELETKRREDSIKQSSLNQELIKNNPIQYSPYAIPPYKADSLKALVKQYEARLPEIEKFRRISAQMALATGKCIRVEADELSVRSETDNLVFSVDCSSGETFYFTEQELVE